MFRSASLFIGTSFTVATVCNIKCRLDCRYSPQNIFNAKNFNPHKKPISLLNVPICTHGMQKTWWPEAGTIIVTYFSKLIVNPVAAISLIPIESSAFCCPDSSWSDHRQRSTIWCLISSEGPLLVTVILWRDVGPAVNWYIVFSQQSRGICDCICLLEHWIGTRQIPHFSWFAKKKSDTNWFWKEFTICAASFSSIFYIFIFII